jgi:glycerol-3-phosphate dehydrogenase subunit B
MDADVIVIGGGMAGTAAALRAAGHGAHVILIRKGFGATAMSSGTIDIAGPTDFLPLDPWDSLPPITHELGRILRTNPLHPYSIIAGGRDRVDELQTHVSNACEFIFDKIPHLGYSGSVERNLALPNAFGMAKFCAFGPSSLIGGNLTEMQDAHMAIVGINGLPFFRAHICKQGLANYSLMHPPSAITNIDAVEAGSFGSGAASPMAPFEVARHFDEPETTKEFAAQLSETLKPEVTHVALPPVLGLNNHAESFDILTSTLQRRVFELISSDFSMPGHRLQLSLEQALERNHVRTVTAEVVDINTNGHNIDNIICRNMREHLTATAQKYVIASGKFGAGGVVATDFPKESIFGIPLFFNDTCVDGRFVQELANPTIGARQPFLSCGIHVDGSLHPLDKHGQPVFENLFAAGAIIGEYDYVADKCGLGVAILTGYIAGDNAAK